MKTTYTVWSADRDKKTLILVDPDEPQLYESVILKACLKLGIDGSSLVLESNGTPVDEEVLPYVNSEILILLEKNQNWSSREDACSSSSLPSTITYVSETQRSEVQDDIEAQNGNIDKPDKLHSIDCNMEFQWSSMQIPWDKLSSDQIDELNRGTKNKNTISSLIHATINEMRCVRPIIPTKAFKIIAKKIIEKYPNIFRDVDDDGIVLGDGSHSLVCRLQDRNNYLNRPHKRKSSCSNPVIGKKRALNARAGCPNWSPIDKNEILHMEGNVKNITESDENFLEVMEQTYSEQRTFVNGNPKFADIKDKWPILCSKLAIYWHFNKLTNSDIHLINEIKEKMIKINNFLNERLKENNPNNGQTETLLELMRKLCSYFKEDFAQLLTHYKDPDSINVDILPITPCIVQIDPEGGTPIYFVYVEREQVNLEGYDTFDEAFKVFFSLFFILNLQYPKGITTVLELIQRMFLKIHPDAGSKSKKVTPTKRKVFNFMNRFRTFCN